MSRWIRSRCCPTWHGGSDQGGALPAALLLLACLVSVTGWVVGHTRVDTDIARSLADQQEAARLAEAATQVVAMALGQAHDWSSVAGIAVPLACPASPGQVIGLDQAAETAALQGAEDASSRWGADTPQWHLGWTCHATGVLGHWPPGTPAPVVGVWLADDTEGDLRPWVDSNQRLRLAGVAVGRGGARALVTATIMRSAPGAPVSLLAWRAGQQE